MALAHADPEQLTKLVRDAQARYRTHGLSYDEQFQQYDPAGDYLNYGVIMDYEGDTTLKFDSRGLPMVAYGGTYHLNPVTVAQFALAKHGRFVRGQGSLDEFLAAADGLLTLQRSDGAFRFPFAYTYYRTGEVFAPGWTSAMAQGLGMSVYARAFALSGSEEYRVGAEAALTYLTNAKSGLANDLGTLDPSLADMLTFEEYPTKTPSYTLNGFGYTLLGLFDWAKLGPGERESVTDASHYYTCGLATFETSVEYYDVGGFSAYDLGHLVLSGDPNLQAAYHSLHIGLLHALASISQGSTLTRYEIRWRSYVDPVP